MAAGQPTQPEVHSNLPLEVQLRLLHQQEVHQHTAVLLIHHLLTQRQAAVVAVVLTARVAVLQVALVVVQAVVAQAAEDNFQFMNLI